MRADGSTAQSQTRLPDSPATLSHVACPRSKRSCIRSPRDRGPSSRMTRDGDEASDRPRRVRPGRIRAERSEGRGLLLRKLSARMQARPTRSRTKGRPLQRPGNGPSARRQRSVVKLQYTANRTPGGWRAHGRYLAREGAQREGEKGLGFEAQSTEVKIDRRLDGWQRAYYPRLWRMILSPERGDSLDLVEHTRRVVDALERDLGTRARMGGRRPLEYGASSRVVIRGRDESGRPLLLDAISSPGCPVLAAPAGRREPGRPVRSDTAARQPHAEPGSGRDASRRCPRPAVGSLLPYRFRRRDAEGARIA